MNNLRLFWIFAVAILAATGLTAGVMKIATADVSPLPPEREEVRLQGLFYGRKEGTRKEITSLRFEVTSEEGADPVRVEWTLTGSNASGSAQRVNLSCILLDENERRVAVARKSIVLKAGSESQESTLNMKAKAKTWEAARTVHIEAAFATLR